MECGSGHEAHRCIGSGFSWGSWLLGVGGEERAELEKEGSLLPWRRARQGHSLLALGVLGMVGGWLRGKRRVMKQPCPCPLGSTTKKVSKRVEAGSYSCHQGSAVLQAACGPPRCPPGPWARPALSVPSSLAAVPTCCCCCCLQRRRRL